MSAQFNMTMAFEINRKGAPQLGGTPFLWLVTRAVGKLKCFTTSSNTLRLYINKRSLSIGEIRVWEKPTPKRTTRHPNDEKQRQDGQPKRSRTNGETEATKQERRTNRNADQASDTNDGATSNPTERTTDEESERRTDDGERSRQPTTEQGANRRAEAEGTQEGTTTSGTNTTNATNEKRSGRTTQGTPPKKFNCLLAILKQLLCFRL